MVNLASHLERTGKARADDPAIALGAAVLHTYGALAARAGALAAGMRERLDISPGDRVLVMSKNCPEYLEILYATWHAGAITVPINAKLHAREAAYIAGNCGASHCFASADFAGPLSHAAPGMAITVIGGTEYESLLATPPIAVAERRCDDPAWIFYTSGTTGQPKGATLSHRNLLAMSHCYLADVDPVSPWSAILHAAPISHGSGLYALPYVMQAGCHVIPQSGGFDEDEVFALIEAWPNIAFFAAPTMVKRLIEHPRPRPTGNLKAIIYGGGPMYLEDCLAGLDCFGNKLTQLYGQGETPMTITALNARQHADTVHPRWLDRLRSVGVAQSAVEVRIADERGGSLPADEVGEVAVRGDTVMLGYWQNPEATAEAIRNGWLFTGDYGALDKDGFLTLKDRSKDLIISGGTNIYPREIEEILLLHDQVLEVAVIGRADDEWGESVVAYVVSRSGKDIDIAELDKLCMAHIARFKRPRHYCFVAGLPKNNYGKILKKALREMDAARTQPKKKGHGTVPL